MDSQLSRFAVLWGNRGFFPSAVVAAAREEVTSTITGRGHTVVRMEATATRHGAVETVEEGRKAAVFLAEHRGEYDGIIVSLPNFGDETGLSEALRDARVPILLQAYPDELDAMSPAQRRDSFCGKLSVMDVFRQCGIRFTALRPHVVSPGSTRFAENLEYFDRVCRVVRTTGRLKVGAIGARTTPFRTVRIDELALERHGVTVETLDLTDLICRVRGIKTGGSDHDGARSLLDRVADWSRVPPDAQDTIARLLAAMRAMTAEYGLQSMSLRCWTELQQELGISPCVANGVLGDLGFPVACEVDTGSAVMMTILSAASGKATAILDWNNNYGADEDRCILFHCGNAPASLMEGRGRVTDHEILKGTVGEGRGYGCNQGRLTPQPITFGNLGTENGAVNVYLGQGEITRDPIPNSFFGVAGVAHIDRLEDVLAHLGDAGHRHHVVLTPGAWLDPVREALGKYLGYKVEIPQRSIA